MDPNIPWNIQPLLLKGDTSLEAVYAAVGAALSAWETMEGHLADLYGALLNSCTLGANAGYGSLTAFTGRIELVKAAELHFPFRDEPDLVDIRDLLDRIGNFSPRRNEIAHGVVYQLSGRATGYYLAPPRYHTNKAPMDSRRDTEAFNYGYGRYTYTAAQIGYYRSQFLKLNAAVAKGTGLVRRAWDEKALPQSGVIVTAPSGAKPRIFRLPNHKSTEPRRPKPTPKS